MTAAVALLMFGTGAAAQPTDAERAARKAERQEHRQEQKQERQEQRQEQRQQRPAVQPQVQQPRPQLQRPQPNPLLQQRQQPAREPRAARPDRPQLQQNQQSPGVRPDRADRLNRPERADRPNRPDRQPRPGGVDGQAGRANGERPARPDRPARAERPDRANRPDRPDSQRNTRPARPDRRTDQARPNRKPRADLPTRPERRANAERRDRRFDANRSRQIRQQARARRAGRNSWTVRVGRHDRRIFRTERYHYPRGYRYRVYRRGDRFPAALLISSYFLSNFLNYGLYQPDMGYRWVRYGPDAVLIDGAGGVVDTRYGVFDDGSAYAYAPATGDLPGIDPALPETFITGEFSLSGSGATCDDFYGDETLQEDIDNAWRDEDWNGLASLMVEGNCESDLSYFLLGLAAEGLQLPDAATSYYQRALDLYDDDSQDNCESWGEDACRGMSIGDEAADGLERIYGQGSDE
jgi:hypothetical protein